ncbi:MAG TPA: hypothetical protein VKN74_04865, partial [Candidatus Mcinerneyibacterium sp.]|nr:hypothetical protein [Candidatus Mcinerneyibacterium sp.]
MVTQFEKFVGGSTPKEVAASQKPKSEAPKPEEKPKVRVSRRSSRKRKSTTAFEQKVGGSNIQEVAAANKARQEKEAEEIRKQSQVEQKQVKGQETSQERFTQAQAQLQRKRLDTRQENINKQGIVGPSRQDIQFLQEQREKNKLSTSDFDKISKVSNRVQADINIQTGMGQGTITPETQKRQDLLTDVTSKKQQQKIKTQATTAAVGFGAVLAGPALPGVVKVAGLGIGALSLSKELDTIAKIRKERPEEAGFRTSNIFAGLFGAGVGVASQRSVYTNLKKFNEFSIGKIEKLDQVRIFPDKLGKIGGKSAKFRSGKISKGQLRKGKDFRQFQKQQENIKDIFKQPGTRKVRIDERNILNIQKTGKTDVVSSLEKIRLGQPISPIVTKQKQFLVTTKGKRGTPALQSLFTKKGVTSGLAKTKSSGKLGAAGQSQRPNRLFTPKSENFIAFKSKTQSSGLVSQQITQTKPQSFKILDKIKTPKPQTTPQATIFKPAPKTSNVKFKPLETTKTSSVAPQQTQQINKGFRQGQRQKIISRLQEKKQTQDFTKTSQQLPKTSSDLQLVKPKTTKTEFKKATRIKKEDKAFTFSSLPQDTRQEQDLGTSRFSGLDLSKQPEISSKSEYNFKQEGFVGPKRPKQETIQKPKPDQTPKPPFVVTRPNRKRSGQGKGQGQKPGDDLTTPPKPPLQQKQQQTNKPTPPT